jgi:carbon-monoxide dehydrogenase iron sulfur subunit
MAKRLLIDLGKCTECRTCELKCSFVHFAVFNSNRSGIQIITRWPELPTARLCSQCDDPACLPSCPSEAMILTKEGSVKVLQELCIGCGSCVDACPYDGVWLEPLTNLAVKCDTCEDRYECVADCFAGALSVEG